MSGRSYDPRKMGAKVTFRWLYVDCNSFFASVQQQVDPSLRGRPVAIVPVASDSTCAIAASYEAKAFGVKTGTPIYEAKKMCPHLVCVLANHSLYVDFHHRVVNEIDRHVPVTKVWSIDEVACELLSNESSVEQATALSYRIKQGLAERVGQWVKCSIGLAPNRYLAKVAADMKKPDGLTLIQASDLPHKLHSLALRDLPGIGARMEQKLKRFGIWSVEKLCSLDLSQMRKAWGSVLGDRMCLQLAGANVPDLETGRTSLGHSHVLAPEFRDVRQARAIAIRLTLKAAARMRRLGLLARGMSLSLQTEERNDYDASLKLYPVSDSLTLLHNLEQLWTSLLRKYGVSRVKKISVNFFEFTGDGAVEPDLFTDSLEQKGREKADRASIAIDKINDRYGADSIVLGVLPKRVSAK